jgi:endonuclease/exonuclease/phosphatase family metal-dependent hydrolase
MLEWGRSGGTDFDHNSSYRSGNTHLLPLEMECVLRYTVNTPFSDITMSGIFEWELFSNGPKRFLAAQRGLFLYSLEPGEGCQTRLRHLEGCRRPEQQVVEVKYQHALRCSGTPASARFDRASERRWRAEQRKATKEIVEPDIICLQEINPVRDPQQVGNRLDAILPLDNDQRWQTHRGQDNVIAARFKLGMRADKLIRSVSVTDLGHAMTLVDLPDSEYENDLYLICAHFQAQGGQANVLDRQEHADAIIAWIGDAKTSGGEIDLPFGTPLIVMGDFNVYDTDPAHHLTTLISGDIENEDEFGRDILPDWDGTGLADALPHHNGMGGEVYTWRDDTQEFNPGALDRILYSDSVLSVDNTFVLNTEIITEEELEAAGLKEGDVMLDPETGRYDHLPLVADISFQDMPSK